jgi:xanthine dehydrogenase accessory factor
MADVLARAAELERDGQPHALATVVRVDRPVSARVGDRAVVRVDGQLDGWIGGSCTAPVVTREALAAMADGRARLVRIRPPGAPPEPDEPDVVTEVTTCASEGGLDVFVEPRLPMPLLVVVGSSPVTRTLAELAKVVGHRVTAVVDGPGEQVPAADATLSVTELEGASFRPQDSVVVATMNRYDETAIMAALATGAGYVGLVASRRRSRTTMANLADKVGADELARIRTPAGFDLGPASQQEIALAVLAEVVAERNRRKGTTGEAQCEPEAASADLPATAVDPVCGMTVAVTASTISAKAPDGTSMWFCGPGCRDAFLAEQAG